MADCLRALLEEIVHEDEPALLSAALQEVLAWLDETHAEHVVMTRP